MTRYNLALLGFGNVGREFARLLLRKREELEKERGLSFAVTAIATGSHGAAIDPAGIPLERALAIAESGSPFDELSTAPAPENKPAFIRASGADVLFENTPVNYKTGQPAIDHLRAALENGMHAITANKGPVVHAYRQLTELAAAKNRKFFFEGTVMDGTPIFSLFRAGLPAASLQSFSGILNSTTNVILTRMEGGASFDEAVAHAQAIGVAETDPSGDIDGWDAAIKIAALATVLMDIPLKPEQVEREGIREIIPEKIAEARAQGRRWKLVCRAERRGNDIHASVSPEMVAPDSPLYNIEGTTSIVKFYTDVLGPLSIIGQDPGPHTTAYALLADFINAVS
jgi:homoserine dehydrogenase